MEVASSLSLLMHLSAHPLWQSVSCQVKIVTRAWKGEQHESPAAASLLELLIDYVGLELAVIYYKWFFTGKQETHRDGDLQVVFYCSLFSLDCFWIRKIFNNVVKKCFKAWSLALFFMTFILVTRTWNPKLMKVSLFIQCFFLNYQQTYLKWCHLPPSSFFLPLSANQNNTWCHGDVRCFLDPGAAAQLNWIWPWTSRLLLVVLLSPALCSLDSDGVPPPTTTFFLTPP